VSEPRRHLGAGAALSVVAQSAPLLAGAVLSVVLARTIGPSGNGRYVLLLTLVGLASMIVSLGLHAGITFEVSRRRWSVARAYRTSFRIALVLGLVGLIAGFGFFYLTRHTVFGGIPGWLALLALASIPLTLAYEYAASILLARERYERYTSLLAVHAATLALIGAGLALPFGLKGAVVGIPASALLGVLLAAKLLADEASRDTTPDGGEPLSRALRFGLQPAAAGQLPLRRPDPRRLRDGGGRRRLLGRPDADEHRVDPAAGAANGAVPACGEPGRVGGDRGSHS
jgi:O-antigen/teichoic acid export membrane protein